MADLAASVPPLGLQLYRAISAAGEPVAAFALKRRLAAGKEDPERILERRGLARIARPAGDLIWIHGASVGESISILPLVERLRELRPSMSSLVTTGTVTSARLMNERLPPGAFHQYAPLDHPRFVSSFLDYWRPCAALFVESEFWPNLILEARKRVPYLALINGRVSPQSFDGWLRQANSIEYVLSAFDTIFAQDLANADRLSTLSRRKVRTYGNLKHAAPELPVDAGALDALRGQMRDRPVWLAASTHPGDEEAVLGAAAMLAKSAPRALLVIAPRHPQRGEEIRAAAAERGLAARCRSRGEPIDDESAVYIADSLGELGLFYRLSEISFVGGSIAKKGGHNPLEPARLGGAILHGPHTFNFSDIYTHMRAAGGSALVRSESEIVAAVKRLLSDGKTRRAMADAARKFAASQAERVLDEVSSRVLNGLDDAGRVQAPII